MISSLLMNNGSQTYAEKRIRSPRADERAGAISTKGGAHSAAKVKTYKVGVKDGALIIADNRRRTVIKHG